MSGWLSIHSFADKTPIWSHLGDGVQSGARVSLKENRHESLKTSVLQGSAHSADIFSSLSPHLVHSLAPLKILHVAGTKKQVAWWGQGTGTPSSLLIRFAGD